MKEVVVFAKAPVPGMVKTRLAATVGPDTAAKGHRAFITDLLSMLGGLDAKTVLAVGSKADLDHDAFHNLGDVEIVVQPEGDLGERLSEITRLRFDGGASRVLLIGTDSPTLGRLQIENAFDALQTHEVALGPTFDGGYYLLGLKKFNEHLFKGIPWSTSEVANATLDALINQELSVQILEYWYDVDTNEDLRFLRFQLKAFLCDDSRTEPLPQATIAWLNELDQRH